LADPKLQEVLKDFVLLHVDLTDPGAGSPASKAAEKFGVRSIPDLRILAPDGSQKQLVDSREAADLAVELKKALGK